MRPHVLAYCLILIPAAASAQQSPKSAEPAALLIAGSAQDALCPIDLGVFQPPEVELGPVPFAALPARPRAERRHEPALAEAPGWVYAQDPYDSLTVEVTLQRLHGSGTALDGRYARVRSNRLQPPETPAEGLGGEADFRFTPGNWETEKCMDRIEDCSPFDAVNAYYHIDRMATEFWRDRMGVDPDFQADVTTHIAGDGAFVDASRDLIKFAVGWIFMRNAAKEDEIIYHEYTHLVQAQLGFTVSIHTPIEGRALSEGFADYFAATFTDDPRFGEWIVTCPPAQGCDGPPNDAEIRTLATDAAEWNWQGGYPSSNLKYGICTRYHEEDTKCKTSWNNYTPQYTWAIIWGSFLWDIRTAVGADLADALILKAMTRTDPDTDTFEFAVWRLVEADQTLNDGANRELLFAAAANRGIVPVTGTDPNVVVLPFRLNVHPHPAGSFMRFDLNMDRSDQVVMTVFDVSGRAVERLFTGFASFGSNRIEWDAGREAPGVYFVRIDLASGPSSVVPVVLAR